MNLNSDYAEFFKKDMGWKCVDDQLPPFDGIYEITNHPQAEDDPYNRLIGTAYYDGLGFEYMGVYRSPRYWRGPRDTEKKKYGPVRK